MKTGQPKGIWKQLQAVLPDEPPGVTEKFLKGRVRQSPYLPGALRWLLHNGHVARGGVGGRSDPYLYWKASS